MQTFSPIGTGFASTSQVGEGLGGSWRELTLADFGKSEISVQDFLAHSEPLGFGTNLSLAASGGFLSAVSRIEEVRSIPFLSYGMQRKILSSGRIANFGSRPFSAFGRAAGVIGAATLTYDLSVTFANPNYSSNQKMGKAVIQSSFAAVAFTVGSVIIANTPIPAAVGLIVFTSSVISVVQDALYERFNLQ